MKAATLTVLRWARARTRHRLSVELITEGCGEFITSKNPLLPPPIVGVRYLCSENVWLINTITPWTGCSFVLYSSFWLFSCKRKGTNHPKLFFRFRLALFLCCCFISCQPFFFQVKGEWSLSLSQSFEKAVPIPLDVLHFPNSLWSHLGRLRESSLRHTGIEPMRLQFRTPAL